MYGKTNISLVSEHGVVYPCMGLLILNLTQVLKPITSTREEPEIGII